jgi:hypothetical protein
MTSEAYIRDFECTVWTEYIADSSQTSLKRFILAKYITQLRAAADYALQHRTAT